MSRARNLLASVTATFLCCGASFAFPLSQYGGACDGSDTTPAFNAAVAAAMASTIDRTITALPCKYEFFTAPSKIVADGGITIEGTSPWSTIFERMFSQGPSDPFIELQGRGHIVRQLAIETAPGTSGGIGLYFYADNTTPPGGKSRVEQVRIAGTNVDVNGVPMHEGTWTVDLWAYGSLRTTQPEGIRVLDMRFVELFDATRTPMEWWGCLACSWYGGGAYQGGGTTQAVIVGGPLGQKNRIDADIDMSVASLVGMRGPGK